MDSNKIYDVKNRSDSIVVYKIPELNIRREFMPGESKKATYEELEKLSFQSGGRELMADYLQIKAAEVTESLNLPTEPEYYMSEQQIIELMTTGSLDAFLDCLDFAPVGVIDLIKKFSISLPLNDMAKRKAILDKTGFDVTKAVMNNEADKENGEPAGTQRERRVKPAETSTEPTRRTSTNYKVVTKAEN